jgi:hypothetical protein
MGGHYEMDIREIAHILQVRDGCNWLRITYAMVVLISTVPNVTVLLLYTELLKGAL